MEGEINKGGRTLAHRYHDISVGHRVAGHESKCARLHGHNYRIHFYVEAEKLDTVGRVIDFSVIKERLCEWLEVRWDHRMLLWQDDVETLAKIGTPVKLGIVVVPFNPTAENMAQHLVEIVGPTALGGTGVRLVKVEIEETAKCSASYELEG